jgi:hypothetical protein
MTLPEADHFSWSITYLGDVALTISGHIQITPDGLFYIVPHSKSEIYRKTAQPINHCL